MPFSFRHSVADEAPIRIPAIGLTLHVRLPAEASGGTLTVIETINEPGFGPPLHRHPETEVFRVLEGRYVYELDGRRFTAEEGDPGGAVHAFRNATARPARQLVMILPGFDAARFFTELGAVMQARLPDGDVLAAWGGRWGMEFLGPPIAA